MIFKDEIFKNSHAITKSMNIIHHLKAMGHQLYEPQQSQAMVNPMQKQPGYKKGKAKKTQVTDYRV